MNKQECEQCDYANPVRLGRCHYHCPICDKDISLQVYLLEELFVNVPDKVETAKRIDQWMKAKHETSAT